ncbi:hypothetical protein PTRA_a2208 [Pseudoalteromonas translucida KMM 520]|uniref:Uncharacterized protein n=1 Tax=Pseudoalteromonas translucida KMM 520 TaxID=1315283 RepID=A0A0U2X0B4_9GAMM|nr:hypothetical protein PTRA_a2208 [Pseudoalteromonas translucida KMM 520]
MFQCLTGKKLLFIGVDTCGLFIILEQIIIYFRLVMSTISVFFEFFILF